MSRNRPRSVEVREPDLAGNPTKNSLPYWLETSSFPCGRTLNKAPILSSQLVWQDFRRRFISETRSEKPEVRSQSLRSEIKNRTSKVSPMVRGNLISGFWFLTSYL